MSKLELKPTPVIHICVPDNLVYLSYPVKYKCKICGEFIYDAYQSN